MLQIVEHTPQRLVLRDHAPGLGLGIGLFALFSLLFMVLIPIQSIASVLAAPDDLTPLRLLTLAGIIAMGAVFTYVGGGIALGVLGGMTCTFDRESATVTIRRARRARPYSTEHSLYAVSHLAVESDTELRTFAVYLALRSGERLLLTSAPSHDRDALEAAMQGVRHFLRT